MGWVALLNCSWNQFHMRTFHLRIVNQTLYLTVYLKFNYLNLNLDEIFFSLLNVRTLDLINRMRTIVSYFWKIHKIWLQWVAYKIDCDHVKLIFQQVQIRQWYVKWNWHQMRWNTSNFASTDFSQVSRVSEFSVQMKITKSLGVFRIIIARRIRPIELDFPTHIVGQY